MWVRGANRTVWTVNRRWLPWRPRFKSDTADAATEVLSGSELLGETILGAIAALVSLIVILVVLLLLLVEWFLVLALIPLLILVRLTGLIPWIIVVRRWDGPVNVIATYYAETKGWVPAWRLVRRIKAEIRETGQPGSLMRGRADQLQA